MFPLYLFFLHFFDTVGWVVVGTKKGIRHVKIRYMLVGVNWLEFSMS